MPDVVACVVQIDVVTVELQPQPQLALLVQEVSQEHVQPVLPEVMTFTGYSFL